MSELISSTDFIGLMQESFERGQSVTFTPSGNSMLPMLDGKSDKVTLSPKPDRLQKYDVVFYRRPQSGQLVLHRLISFTKDGGYVFSGDSQYSYEYGIGDQDILALMTSFTHNGQEIGTDEPAYRRYIRRVMLKKRLRRLAGRLYHVVTDRFRH